MIYYNQPVPGLDEDNNEITCNQQVGVTIEDAIMIQRYVCKMSSAARLRKYKELTREQLLTEYEVVHYTWEEI